MSDRVVQSYHDCDGISGQSMRPYQSSWMAHWTGTSCNAPPQMHSPSGKKKDDNFLSGPETVSDISRSAKRFKEVEARAFEIKNESVIVSSKKSRNENLEFQSSPIVNICRGSGSGSISKNDQDTSLVQAFKPQNEHDFENSTCAPCTMGSRFPSVLAVAPPAAETSSRKFHVDPEGVSLNSAALDKSRLSSRLAVSRPSHDNFTGSASHVVPYRFGTGEFRFDSERSAVPPFMREQVEINQSRSVLASKELRSNTNPTIMEEEHCNFHSHSSFLVCEKKLDNLSNSGISVIPYSRQNNSSLLLNDPSTNINHSGVRLLQCQSSPPETTKLEKLHYGRCSPQRIPQSVRHVGTTTRICTSVDSVEGLVGGPPRFSQTTSSLLITEKTDINLCKENQILREPGSSTQQKDSKGEENVEDVKASEVVKKNESSAETDTMDMDSFKEKNYLSGVNSSPSNKDIMAESELPLQAATASAGEEVGYRRPITMLPDINLELPPLPSAASSMDNAEPSTSRTQSLDMQLVLLHAEQPSNSISNHSPDTSLGPEPSSRWVKRLKLGTSDSFALGTKNSNLGEASSHVKVSKYVSTIKKGSISSSQLTIGKHHGKELMVLDQTTALLRNGESYSGDTPKKATDIMLSNAWIQRWCHNRAATPQKKPEAVVVCEPQTSKVASEDFQKKRFPSIAAMALMGKAMSGFQSCEIQNRGSFVVWSTKGF